MEWIAGYGWFKGKAQYKGFDRESKSGAGGFWYWDPFDLSHFDGKCKHGLFEKRCSLRWEGSKEFG